MHTINKQQRSDDGESSEIQILSSPPAAIQTQASLSPRDNQYNRSRSLTVHNNNFSFNNSAWEGYSIESSDTDEGSSRSNSPAPLLRSHSPAPLLRYEARPGALSPSISITKVTTTDKSQSTVNVSDTHTNDDAVWGSGVWRRCKAALSPKIDRDTQEDKAWGHKYIRYIYTIPRKYKFWVLLSYILLCGSIIYTMFYYNNYNATTEMGKPLILNADTRGSFITVSETGAYSPIRCPPFTSTYSGAWYVTGTSIYRSDSRVCMAAVHAGIINDATGGCALYRQRAVSDSSFVGSLAHGIQSRNSTEFDSRPFDFQKCTNPSGCEYWGFPIFLPVTLLMFLGLVFLRAPSAVLFTCLAVVGYWYVILIGQPMYTISFVQERLGLFLPYLAAVYVLWIYGGKAAIPAPTHMIERSLLYILPCWAFLHMNYLTLVFPDEDISSKNASTDGGSAVTWNPISITLLAVAIPIVLVLLFFLFRSIWRSGKTIYYILGYTGVIALVGIFWALVSPQFYFHLHHYQVALLMWPLAMFSIRPAALTQAIMLGVFINGVARWGWASTFTA